MKIFMMTDLEGVAGVTSFTSQAYADGKYYEQSKQLLTAEVNAAVAAMVAEGVTDVLVLDAHGPGGINYADIKPPARLMHGRPIQIQKTMVCVQQFDACVMIGQHAMAGTADGDMNHTQSSASVDYYKLNGRPIGETAQFALYVGAYGKPMIFLSGDEAACREVRELIPGVTTAAVKEGLGRNCAISLAQADSHALIARQIREAIRHHRQKPIAPLVWPGPYVLEKRFFHTDVADQNCWKGVERVDSQTVRMKADNILDIIFA